MTTIEGTTGKAQALFDFLEKLQVEATLFESDHQDRKKRKLDHDQSVSDKPLFNYTIELPLTLHNVDRELVEQLASAFSNNFDQKLVSEWSYMTLEDTIFASMKIVSDHTLLAENECMLMSNQFKQANTEIIEGQTQLLVAIIYAASMQFIEATDIQIRGSNTKLSVFVRFVQKKKNTNKLIRALSDHVHIEQLTRIEKACTSKTLPALVSPPSTAPASLPPPPSYPSFVPVPNNTSIDAFYQYLQPPVSNTRLKPYLSPRISAQLTPFQSQNVEWMMLREGHYADTKGDVYPNHNILDGLPLLYANDQKGNYLNVFNHQTVTERSDIMDLIQQSFRGGILADEMGLGKTISVLGLIAKHTWNKHDPFHPPINHSDLVSSKTTLIIAPSPIISQWCSEIEKHAPQLSYFVYEGRRSQPHIGKEQLLAYDIVLTHYEAFRSEIYYTKPPPDRPHRAGVNYKQSYRMSPLVSIHWFRCILDEAQMIEANVSRVAAVAKCIPAWYRWAVTGTPLKNDLSQLYGLYDFLGLEKSIHSPQQFQKLCKDPEYKSVFYEFARATMRRNMKAALHNQVHIPKQHRHVVRIPFGTIEQHYYEDLWRACQSQLKLEWLDSINWTLSDTASEEQINEFNASRQKMRLWLLALRQGCIHPSMISNTTLGLGNQQPGNTSKKTHSLDNVLQYMSKSAEDRLDTEQHAYYSMQLKRGGMHEVLKQWQEAVDVYTKHILDVEKQVETYLQGKSSTEEQEKNAAQHLYKWQILLHRYYFYTAGVYHMLESKDLEEACYDKASQLRQLIMDSYTTRVNESTLEMDKAAARVQLTPEYRLGPRVIDTSFIDQLEYEDEIKDNEEEEEEEDLFAMKGQRAADKNILENVKQLGFILDEQLKKIMYLRKKILPILRKPLVDSNNEETEVTGDEYEESLNEQEMCQVYLAAYQALLQDRKFIIKGTIATSSDIEPVGSESSMSEEAKNVERVEKIFRKQTREPGFEVEHIKDVEYSLKALKERFHNNPKHTDIYNILDTEQRNIASCLPHQNKLIDHLDNDFKKINQLFNSRVAYYKYLQNISDTLTEWKHRNPREELARMDIEQEKNKDLIAQCKSRAQYFKTLMEEQKELEKAPKRCLVCQEHFEKGMITYCGHTCCYDCGIRWFKTSQRCHTCNSRVKLNEWYTISYKSMEMHNKDGSYATHQVNASMHQEPDTVKLIKEIGTQGIIEGQGAKLDAIIRHVKHIKTMSNGKCVIFSQWSKALDMLKAGLAANDIKYLSLNTGAALNRKNVIHFQNDPTINVILLDARSQSSGLTLVAAHTVFIVEPVINESIEKQAINRIHRIGQTKETHVFWYIVQDTIEERIQAIHDMKRDNKNLQDTQLAKISDGGGEFVNNDDLRKCFTMNSLY